VAAAGAVAVAVVAAVLVLVLGGGDGSRADRRAALRAADALEARVTARALAPAADLCAAVGPRTRAGLARLAQFLPRRGTSCAALPARTVRVVLAPPPGTTGRPIRARIAGAVAVLTTPDGAEVSRATRRGTAWRADPGAGGLGAWRLQTAERCSAALTASRLTPLTGDAAGYRRAMAVRLRGVSSVLEMLRPGRLPRALRGRVAASRGSLEALRDGLRGGLGATDGGVLAEAAPDGAELPSVLALQEALAGLAQVGAPCLGGPSSSRAVRAGDAVCRDARLPVDMGFRGVGRSASSAGVAAGFRTLAAGWRALATGTAGIDLGQAPRLAPVRDTAVQSARDAAAHADRLAIAAGSGGTDARVAAEFDLAQQRSVDALLALGFGACAAVS
jgi:hypothetical protein